MVKTTIYILVRKLPMAKANANSKENENVFSEVEKRWPIQRSQVVELLIQEFTQLWILLIKIRFPCVNNPLSFPKAAEANIKSRWRFHLNWWPVWKSSSYKRIFSVSSSGKKLECTMGEYCRLTQWCHHLKSNFCTKEWYSKWIGFFVPMLQWMSHSETNRIRSSAIWHST